MEGPKRGTPNTFQREGVSAMSNKWLQREGLRWVEKEIISQQQYKEIMKLYPESPRRITQILPILASILVGLSLLTFVASNWDGIPDMGRMAILILTMVGFYSSGFYVYRQGHIWVGQGLLALGVVSFGASMILMGQMFHLIAYDARVFVLWSLAGLGLMYLYRLPLFFLLTAVLLFVGQIYAMVSFQEASWVLLGLTIFGLGTYAYRSNTFYSGWIMAFLIGLQTILIMVSEEVAWSWVSLVPIGVYVVGLFLGDKPIAQGFIAWPAAFGFAFSIIMIFIHEQAYDEPEFLANTFAYSSIYLVLFALSIWKSRREKGKLLPLLLFLPLFYLPFGDIAYLAVIFIFSSLMIYFGDESDDRWQSNLGVFLFMLSSFVGYIQLAWDFLDKSLFFLIGGLLLFAIHWILRKRNRWIGKGEM